MPRAYTAEIWRTLKVTESGDITVTSEDVAAKLATLGLTLSNATKAQIKGALEEILEERKDNIAWRSEDHELYDLHVGSFEEVHGEPPHSI